MSFLCICHHSSSLMGWNLNSPKVVKVPPNFSSYLSYYFLEPRRLAILIPCNSQEGHAMQDSILCKYDSLWLCCNTFHSLFIQQIFTTFWMIVSSEVPSQCSLGRLGNLSHILFLWHLSCLCNGLFICLLHCSVPSFSVGMKDMTYRMCIINKIKIHALFVFIIHEFIFE